MKKDKLPEWITVILSIIMIILLILINVRLPSFSSSKLYLTVRAEDTPGEVDIWLYNAGDYISNGTISAILLQNGIINIEEKTTYTRSIVGETGKNYVLKFDSFIRSTLEYVVFVRVDADGRTKSTEIDATWY